MRIRFEAVHSAVADGPDGKPLKLTGVPGQVADWPDAAAQFAIRLGRAVAISGEAERPRKAKKKMVRQVKDKMARKRRTK